MSQSLTDHLDPSLQFLVAPIIALVIFIIGWVVAVIARTLVSGAINRTGIGRKAQSTGGNIGKSIGKALFWIIMLVVVLLALGQFERLKEPLEPLYGMMDGVLGAGGNIIGAVLFLVVGGLVARVSKEAAQSTLEAVQVNNFASKVGLTDETSGSNIPQALGGLVFAIVLTLFAIAAISTLGIEAISEPVSRMLGTILQYIWPIIGSAIVLAISVWIGRFVRTLAINTLPALGVDSSLETITSLNAGRENGMKPSVLIGTIGMIGVVLMGLSAAMDILNIEVLTNVFNTLLEVGGRAVLAVLIIGTGFFIATFVARMASQAGGHLAGNIVKYATIVLFTFMGLETLRLGEGIVDIAFRYSVMAAAVAAGVGGAIAFGLGGREWAGKKLQEWFPAKSTQTTRK
ncbi:MAG: mechanosensitive ion channel [Hyphomonadaceae bacterium]|nr:mechanosensitive ion channel [Hyphomonadaceae bacterium]